MTAVFLRNWDTADETGKCLADEDYKDAEFICKKLDVPLLEVNFVKEYWNDVFRYGLILLQFINLELMCIYLVNFDFKLFTRWLSKWYYTKP